MDAEKLAAKGVLPPGNGTPGRTCGQLLTADGGGVDGGITDGVDFWKLPAIPAGTFANNTTKLLVLTGCTSDTPADPNCGPGFTSTGAPGNGNLAIRVYNLDRTTAVAATSMGIEFVHASANIDLAVAAAGGAKPGLSNDAGANYRPFVAADAATPLYNKTTLIQIPNVTIQGDYLIMNPNVAATAVSLAQTQDISFAAVQGDAGTQGYGNGKAFTFISVGQVGGAGSKQFHYLGFPNDPIVSTYTPP
jgi:hypothetical protein